MMHAWSGCEAGEIVEIESDEEGDDDLRDSSVSDKIR